MQMQLALLLLVFALTTSWLVLHTSGQHGPSGGSISGGTTAQYAARLQHLDATFVGRVQSKYGGSSYWQLAVNYSSPPAPSMLAKARYRVSNKTCWQLASAHPETHSSLYQPTQRPPTVST